MKSAEEDPFRGTDLARAIADRAAREGIVLDAAAARALAAHARAVLAENPRLHLTTIAAPGPFLERHLGEAFSGAALLHEGVAGVLVDLGSGNGYPGVPLAAARPGLRAVLVEASRKKAAFLRRAVEATGLDRVAVLERRVERASDLEDVEPIAVLAARAVGGWERILPRVARRLVPGGTVLLWAGARVEEVSRRKSWRVLELVVRRPLGGRERSWVWCFRVRALPSCPSSS